MPPLKDSLLQSSIAKRIEAIKAMSKTADEFQIFISEFSTSLQDSAPYSFLDTNRLSNTPASARKELSGVRYQEYRKDLGIEALAGYTYNSAYLFEEPESMYRHSMYAGVRWRLLKGGLGESRSRARQAQTFIERDSIDALDEAARTLLAATSDNILSASCRLKGRLLESYSRFLSENVEIARRLYHLGALHSEDLMAIQRDQDRARSLLQISNSIASKSTGGIHLVEPQTVDLERLLSIAKIRTDSLVMFKEAKSQHTTMGSAACNINLDAFVRENIYSHTGELSQGLSGGLSLIVPLDFITAPRQAAWQAQLRQIETQTDARRKKSIDEICNRYYEYSYLLQEYVQARYNAKRLWERLRRQHLSLSPAQADNEPMAVYQRVKDLFDNQLQQLEIRERLNLKLVQLASAAGLPDIGSCFTPCTTATPQVSPVRIGNREIYLWAKDFALHENVYLTDLCQAKGIKRILLSYSVNNDNVKVREFIGLCHSKDIEVYLMLSETTLLEPRKRATLDEKLQLIGDLAPDGLHLDIEPQMIDGWKDDNYRLVRTYLDMLTHVRSVWSSSLSVSIPIGYPPDILADLAGKVDYVNVMAYERPHVEAIAKVIREEIEALGTKLHVALRCSDFEDEDALESTVKALHDRYAIDNFALYDLHKYIELVLIK